MTGAYRESQLVFRDFLLILGQIMQVIACSKAMNNALLTSYYTFSDYRIAVTD